MNNINIAFFGTSDRSEPILQVLKARKEFNLALCVTKDDTVVGRKRVVRETGVKRWAKENKINFLIVKSLKDEFSIVVEQLLDAKVGLGLVADFSFIIPEEIINTPKYGLVNIHFSLLPRWRGASPVQFSILNGDEKTGITYHLVTKEMDRGDILEQVEYKLGNSETSGELYNKLFKIAAENLPKVLNSYVSGKAKLKKQNEDRATYTYSPTHPKSTFIYKEDAKIDWNKPVEYIERLVRAYHPWPIAWTTLKELEKGLGLKIRNDKKSGEAGNLRVKVFSSEISQDSLKINKIQVEGGKVLTWEEFANGYLESWQQQALF
jgi:methionyl-tRNA formyltransferase